MIPLEEMWIREVDTIKVVADPRRLKILHLMAKPITVKALAAEFDLPPSKLYYHVKLLEKHHLIEVVDHNIESGIVEKVYQTAARQFRLVNPLLEGDRVPGEAAEALFSTMLEETHRDFIDALNQPDPKEGVPPRHPFLSKKKIRLNDKQLTYVYQKLVALIEEAQKFEPTQNNDAENNSNTYDLTVAFYKNPPAEKENGDE